MHGKIVIGTSLETKKFEHQIQKLEKEAETIEQALESDLTIPVKFRMNEKERLELESKLEQLKNQIISLQDKANQDIKLGNAKGFEHLWKSVKRLSLGLIGIRSVYSLLSRASQSYLQTDSNATNQVEANWIGLGTILEPIINLLINLFKKAVTSILYFMSVLTGTNYIAKVNTAILKKQTQATNDLTKANNKLTTSFDELTIMQDNSSSTDISQIDNTSLFDLMDISESTRKVIEKIGEALKPVYNIIKSIIDYCLENPDIVARILGATSLLTLLGKIIGVAGTGTVLGTGLAGILGLLLAIASIGVIVVTIKTIYETDKIAQQEIEETNELQKSAIDNYEEMKTALDEIAKSSENISLKSEKLSNAYRNVATNSMYATERNLEQLESLGGLKRLIPSVEKEYQGQAEAMQQNIKESYEMLNMWGELYRQGSLNEEQTKEYQSTLKNFNSLLSENSNEISILSDDYDWATGKSEEFENMQKNVMLALAETYGITKDDLSPALNDFGIISSQTKDKVKNFLKELSKLDDKKVEIDISMETKEAKETLTKFFSRFQSTISTTFSAVGLKVPTFPTIKLAHGGIINNPGKGVSLTRDTIGGEAGREMVLPLATETMEQIGQEIGKWITINANIINEIDGRTFSRVIKKINSANSFANNR